MSQHPPTTVVVTSQPTRNYDNLNVSACRGLAATQLTIGIVLIVLEIVLILLVLNLGGLAASSGQGFWAGIFIIIAGGLGLGAAGNRNKCLCIACAVLSIIAAVFSFIGMIISFILCTGLALLHHYYNLGRLEAAIAVTVISGILLLVEVGVGIAQSVICLRPACSQTVTQTVGYTNQATVFVNQPPGYVVQTGGAGQPVGYPGQAHTQPTYVVQATPQQNYPGGKPAY